MRAVLSLLAACAVLLAGTLPQARAEDDVYYSISGKVLVAGSDKIIAGAQVTVGTKTMVSDDAGFFELDLLPGNYTFEVTADGYWKYSGNLTISGNLTRDFELKKKPDQSACGIIWMALAIPLLGVAAVGSRGRKRPQG